MNDIRRVANLAQSVAETKLTLPVFDDGREAAFQQWYADFSSTWSKRTQVATTTSFWFRVFCVGWDAAKAKFTTKGGGK